CAVLLPAPYAAVLITLRRNPRPHFRGHHATHPEEGCVLPTLGPEIAKASPQVKARVERSLKRLHDSWAERLEDNDAGWALIAQCVGALLLARVAESERTRQEILASRRRFPDKAHQDGRG